MWINLRRMIEWMNELYLRRMKGWKDEWMNEWTTWEGRMNEWMNYLRRMNEWMNYMRRMNEWMNERMNELPEKERWMKEWMNHIHGMNEWTCEWWMNELLDGLNGIPGNIMSSFGKFVFKFLYILECTGSPLDKINIRYNNVEQRTLYCTYAGRIKQLRCFFRNACSAKYRVYIFLKNYLPKWGK